MFAEAAVEAVGQAWVELDQRAEVRRWQTSMLLRQCYEKDQVKYCTHVVVEARGGLLIAMLVSIVEVVSLVPFLRDDGEEILRKLLGSVEHVFVWTSNVDVHGVLAFASNVRFDEPGTLSLDLNAGVGLLLDMLDKQTARSNDFGSNVEVAEVV